MHSLGRAHRTLPGDRQPITAAVDKNPEQRVLEPAFMQMRHAVGIPKTPDRRLCCIRR
jgi:hypothetical protein